MSRLVLSCLLLIFGLEVFPQKTVRIEFLPGSPEDFDVYFKKGFESEGYTAYVNYLGRSSGKPYDLLFTYEWDDNVLKGLLTTKDGELIKQKEEKIIYFDRIEPKTYQFLGSMLGKVITVKDRKGRLKHTLGLVGVEMAKLDSAIYILTVDGSETMSMKMVQNEFLNISQQLTGSFTTYFEEYYHQYQTGEYWLPSSQCIGWEVRGVIMGTELVGRPYIRVPDPPEVFLKYLAQLSDGYTFPVPNPVNENEQFICIMRNSNKSADYGANIIYLDGKAVCDLDFKKYVLVRVRPGLHTILVKPLDMSSNQNLPQLEIKVIPFNNAFVSVIWSFHVGIMYQQVTDYQARLLIMGLSQQECETDK